MEKFSEEQYQKYWKEAHFKGEDDICYVCFPDKPKFFNLFFDRIQKRIIKKHIRKSHMVCGGAEIIGYWLWQRKMVRIFPIFWSETRRN